MRSSNLRKVFLAAAGCVSLAAPGVAYAAQGTASGIVVSLPPSVLIIETQSNGVTTTTSECVVWEGRLKTSSGQSVTFTIESPMTGTLSPPDLRPTDPNAIRTFNTLQKGAVDTFDGKRAVVTISYVDSEVACGRTLTNVVTSASLTLQKQELCVVPRLEGKSLAAARKALQNAHCAVGRITKHTSSTVSNGKVISSSPKAGSKRRAGTGVALTVSRGKH